MKRAALLASFSLAAFAGSAAAAPQPPALPPACFQVTFTYLGVEGAKGDAAYVIYVGQQTLERGLLKLDGTSYKVSEVCLPSSRQHRVLHAKTNVQWDEDCAACDVKVTIVRARR